MKKIRNNNKGFTLVEMMIVLLIISVLILVTIPNVTKQSASIDSKGCEALVKMVEGQVGSYKIDHKEVPASMDQLIEDNYLTDSNKTCSNGDDIIITNGIVTVKKKNDE